MASSSGSSEKWRGWFSPALMKKGFTRFWPIWGVYTAIWFFLLPMEIMVNGGWTMSSFLMNTAMVVAIPLGAFFGLITAMALFSYLMSARATQMFHALPVRREGLFITNWVTGLGFFLLPNLVILALSLMACGVVGAKGGADLLLWFAVATAAPMFFFCFAMMCAMFTGNILALPVFYGILNVLVIGVCALLDEAGEVLLYNYYGSTLASSDPARWCTPVFQTIYLLVEGRTLVNATAAVCGYCVVLGATATVIALLVYRERALERAGDLVTVGWVRPVFQWGFGACVGLLLGLAIYANFFRDLGPWGYIGSVTVWAVIGACAGRMLLKKTLRVFADGWKSCLALGLCVCLLMTGVMMDVFGFQRWSPDPGKVDSVYVNGLHSWPGDDARYRGMGTRDPDLIAQVVDLHKALNAKLPLLQESKRTGVMEGYDDNGNVQTAGWVNFIYTMTDNDEVTRRYTSVPMSGADLDDPDSYTYKMNALINDPRVEAESYGVAWEEDPGDLRATGGWITWVAYEYEWMEEPALLSPTEAPAATAVPTTEWERMGIDTPVVDDVKTTGWEEYTLDTQDAAALWKAFREDLAAGRVRRYLLDTAEVRDNCYDNQITLSLSWSVVNQKGERYTTGRDLTFTLQKSQTSVMAVLEKMGLADRLSQGQPWR